MTMEPVPIFVLMGTAGCGKTSVATALQERLNCEYIEGDVLHPQSNVDKMAKGYPLNDDDRWPWLRLIRDHLSEKAKELQTLDIQSSKRAIVVTCSSLRKVYRDILREVPAEIGTVCFVYLKGTPELLLERIQGRKGHFMASTMLQSQLDTLEEPIETVENVIIASIVPPPDIEAKEIIDAAIEKGLLPTNFV